MSPLRCLRMDMAIELVSEVWVMVSHGVLHHHRHVGEGVKGQILNSEKLRKCPNSLMVRPTTLYCIPRSPLVAVLPKG